MDINQRAAALGPAWPRTGLALMVLLALCAAVWSSHVYAGSTAILLLFHLAFWAMLLLQLPKPRLDAYFFLAVFLFLGIWLKFMVHLAWTYKFLEPIGSFDGSAHSWDRVLRAAAAAAAGVALCRCVHLLLSRRCTALASAPPSPLPAWYARYRLAVWAFCVIAALALYWANYQFAFFQVGVNSRLVLPLKLNVLISWACYCGIALLFACLLEWELEFKPRHVLWLIVTITALSVVASISILSRAVTVFLVAAFTLAILLHRPDLRGRFWSTFGWRLPFVIAVALLVSLVAVAWLRVHLYTPATVANTASSAVLEANSKEKAAVGGITQPSIQHHAPANASLVCVDGQLVSTIAKPAPTRIDWARSFVTGLLQLAVDRWVGLEGLMTVTSSDAPLGLALLIQGVRENPALGIDSLYQKLAKSRYCTDAHFTFLTLAGPAAILSYSGSWVIVLAGMFMMCAVIVVTELLAFRLCGSRFLTALLGIYMTSAICQMNFPFLWFVFVAENLLAVVGFYLLRMPWTARPLAGSSLD